MSRPPDPMAGGFTDEQLADSAAAAAAVLRSLAERWRMRAQAGRLGTHPMAEVIRLVGSLDAAALLLEHGWNTPPPGSVEAPARALLAESEERFRLLVDNVEDYAICLLDTDANITSWNVGAERITGYHAEDVLGRPVWMLHEREDEELVRQGLGTALREGRHAWEGWQLRKDGQRFRANVVHTPLRDARGRVRGYAQITRDVSELHRVSLALRASEERMRLMVDAVRDYAIFMLDPEGNIASWNTGAQRLKGYRAEEIIGKHFSIFYTQPDRDRAHPQDELRRAILEGRYEEEGWRVRKDGSQFWANVVITALFDESGRHVGFTKVTRDFTERRTAAEELRASEERTRLLVESVRDYAIFMLDPRGNISTWNRGAERIKGYRAEEIIGKHFSIFYEEDLRRRGHPEYELEYAMTHGSYGEEGWRLRKDGTRFWASVVITTLRDHQGRHIGFAKVTRDLTERREAEEQLRQSEERLRLLVGSVKDYAIFMLDPEGRITTWNAGAERIKGFTAEEVIGKHFSIFYPPEDAATGRPAQELQTAIRDGRYEEEGWRLRKDGTRFWANVVLTAIHDGSNQLRGFAKVTRDLTEKRRLEQETQQAIRRAAEEEARAHEAQAAVRLREEFISVAAHELRTPLTAIQLKIQGVQQALKRTEDADRGGPPRAPLMERLAGAGRQVERLSELVERLLDVSSISAGRLRLNPQEMDLATSVQATVEDFREPALHAGCELNVQVVDRAVGIWDRARLEQVLVNLLSNAIKYGAGKPVDVRLEETRDGVRLTIADHGIGIGPQDIGRVFERFERAVSARNYGGLGLGLYITRHIVEAHGGSIRVCSTPEEGATFTMELPRRAPAAVARTEAEGHP